MFQIDDELHAEPQAGEYATLADAIEELKRRCTIPWNEHPNVAPQKQHLERKLEREWLLLGHLPALSATILELARERGRVTIADVVTVTGQSRHTIKDHMKSLARGGHLTLHGAGRGAWYGLG